MGARDQQPATLPAGPVEDVQLPTEAQKPSAATAKALLAGVDLSDARAVAAVLFHNPRHKEELLEVVAREQGNRAVSEVVRLAKEMGKEWTDRDHSDDVDHRDQLATGDAAGDARGSAPSWADRLPYTKKGWDAVQINQKLGQADQLKGTDSDGARCAFAVALAAQIFSGPDHVASWMVAYLNEKKPSSKGAMTHRREAARDTLLAVAGAVGGRTATYGDMSWAQEAMHAYLLEDDQGGVSSSQDALVNSMETYDKQSGVEPGLSEEQTKKAAAANDGYVILTPEALFDQVLALAEGERIMVVLKKLPRGATAIEAHQVMIQRHGGKAYYYDPEGTTHLEEATEDRLRAIFDDKDFLGNDKYDSIIAVVQARVSPKPDAPQPTAARR